MVTFKQANLTEAEKAQITETLIDLDRTIRMLRECPIAEARLPVRYLITARRSLERLAMESFIAATFS